MAQLKKRNLFHKVESASESIELFFNPSKPKYVHINPSSNHSKHTLEGSEIENVEDIK